MPAIFGANTGFVYIGLVYIHIGIIHLGTRTSRTRERHGQARKPPRTGDQKKRNLRRRLLCAGGVGVPVGGRYFFLDIDDTALGETKLEKKNEGQGSEESM